MSDMTAWLIVAACLLVWAAWFGVFVWPWPRIARRRRLRARMDRMAKLFPDDPVWQACMTARINEQPESREEREWVRSMRGKWTDSGGDDGSV